MCKSWFALLAALATAVVLAGEPAAAREYPWCAQYGARGDGGRNCGFISFEQCMATVSGIGGFCERNSFYRPPPDKRRSRHR